MPSATPNSDSLAPGAGQFNTTMWTVVLSAGGDNSQARDALARLCQHYWYPLYAYVRRRGHGPHDAQDLTQEFFARLLQTDFLAGVAREKGKFRSFLLASVNHFLANEWNRARTQKRGGGQRLISLDDTEAEARYGLEPADTMSADKIFERRWAMTLLDQVLARLQGEYQESGKSALYDNLKANLMGKDAGVGYAKLGVRLGLSEGAVKVAVHRLRRRYRELLREEIAQTVSRPEEIEEEMRGLFAALGS